MLFLPLRCVLPGLWAEGWENALGGDLSRTRFTRFKVWFWLRMVSGTWRNQHEPYFSHFQSGNNIQTSRVPPPAAPLAFAPPESSWFVAHQSGLPRQCRQSRDFFETMIEKHMMIRLPEMECSVVIYFKNWSLKKCRSDPCHSFHAFLPEEASLC